MERFVVYCRVLITDAEKNTLFPALGIFGV